MVASVGALYITLWGTLIAALKQKGEGDLEVRYGKGFIMLVREQFSLAKSVISCMR